jgi:hypothetical protein
MLNEFNRLVGHQIACLNPFFFRANAEPGEAYKVECCAYVSIPFSSGPMLNVMRWAFL